jgi:hypothetical protein
MWSQTQFLLTTKIFTAKDRLKGGGKLCERMEVNNIYEISTKNCENIADYLRECLAVRVFLEMNEIVITSMVQTEDWNWMKLFKEIYTYTQSALTWLNSQEEGCVDPKGMMFEIQYSLHLLEIIAEKLIEDIKRLDERPIPKYYDNPDDPPIEKCESLSFVVCPNYHTCTKIITFDLQYVIEKMKEMSYRFNYTEEALNCTPYLPPNEYRWWGCPLEYESIYTQVIYYVHWNSFRNNERINQDEIYEIAKLDKLCKKYNIKWNDWIWEFLASNWQMDVEDLKGELYGEPWYFFLDQYNDNDYYEWRKGIRKKGYNQSRGEIREIEAIKKKVEENYIK